jgi:hypothetical protein
MINGLVYHDKQQPVSVWSDRLLAFLEQMGYGQPGSLIDIGWTGI